MRKTLLFLGLGLLLTNHVNSQTWQQQNTGSQNDYNTIFATSDARVCVYGDSTDIFGGFAEGTQFLTSNQGYSWGNYPLNSIVYSARDSYFTSTSIGYVVGKNQLSGNGYIIKTTNGGGTWTEGLPHVEKLEGVHFESANLGYAVGRNDYVTKTIDGGLNWTDVSANTGDNLLDVSFTTELNGYVVGRAGVVAYTIDGASTWVNQTSNTPEDLEAVWFVNDSTGWAVGRAGTIVFTNNYGTTWSNQISNTPEDLLDVAFVNDTTGWAVGTAGTVVKTVDGGQNWIAENSGTGEDIFSITMRSDQLGWFCGKNGTVFIYTVTLPNAIEEVNNKVNFSITPNPMNEITTLKFENSENVEFNVEIIDISGKTVREYKVLSNSILNIERDGLQSGMYLVKLKYKNSISTQKLIIK